ncbi:hypothetical protein HID58_042418 [Brassica napus]|uniref:Uncharacterized protein n=1 Tax=Brassica napus TaxID=3708 RepID=A0ABQ8BDL9_BRANA|nr:hypothetical protein HID58_042418 [Brassica napus]
MSASGLTVTPPRFHFRYRSDRKMAFEDEIQGARNFLIQQYAGHKPSVDAIESAHDKIIMQKFHERKNPKIDITKKVRQVLLSVVPTFYFIQLWSFLYGTGSFVFSWLIGTFLMVSVIPPFIKGPRGFEVMSSLISYVMLWVASSYLR